MITTNSISIALANNNVEWSNKYDNVILFNNDSEILSYLGLTDADFKPYNFPLFSSTKPRDVVIDLSHTNKNVYDIVNSNYFVAKLETSDGKTKYYYYFVNSATQSTQNTFVLTLTLDIFTTYKLNVDFQIKNVLTERKHCDRFEIKAVSTGGKKFYAFANDPNSEVMIEDDIEQAEYPKYIEQVINPLEDTRPNNPKLWLYLYVSLPTGITAPGDKSDGQVISGEVGTPYESYVNTNYRYEMENKTIVNNFAVLIAPLETIKVKNIPYKGDGATAQDNWKGWTEFERNASNLIKYFGNGNGPNLGRYTGAFKVYGASIGHLPPMNFSIYDGVLDYKTLQYSNLDNNRVVFSYVEALNGDYTSDNYFAPFLIRSTFTTYGNFVADLDFEITGVNGKFEFEPKTDRAKRNVNYEPKLFKSAFRSLRLKTNISEVYKDYPLLNCMGLSPRIIADTDTKIRFFYCEIPAIDGITCFSTLLSKPGNEYTEFNIDNYIGNIYKNNFSFAITDDAYTTYLQNNKNAYLTGLVLPTATKVINGATSLIGQRNPTNIFKNMLDTAVDTVGGIANFNLKMDNLQNTPDSLKYIQSNSIEALLNEDIGFGSYIEYWQAYDIYLNLAYNYFYTMGYKVNKFTSSNERNNRYYFNYVKTAESSESKIISTIPLSLEIKTLISNALQNGITFWNYVSNFVYLDYTMENWENNLL